MRSKQSGLPFVWPKRMDRDNPDLQFQCTVQVTSIGLDLTPKPVFTSTVRLVSSLHINGKRLYILVHTPSVQKRVYV
jgi:hypothetical protein